MKNVNVSNVKDYDALPTSERECYGIYRTPEFYEMKGESFEDYWKQKYPIQFFVRNSSENFWITLSVWKDKIIDNTWRRLFPRNAWARKIIPHTYSDKVELIQDFLFASIIDFVEKNPKVISLIRSLKNNNLNDDELEKIETSINKNKTKCLIVAAGLGSRLKGHTENNPKCMLDFGGKTFFWSETINQSSDRMNEVKILVGKNQQATLYELRVFIEKK